MMGRWVFSFVILTLFLLAGCSTRLRDVDMDALSLSLQNITSSNAGIFRSVGPGNTAALATGAANPMTINGTTATFTSALPNNIGVGDVIQYNSADLGVPNSLAFISGRVSASVFLIQDVSGGSAVAATAANTGWRIFRAYTSLYSALYGQGLENSGIDASLRDFDTWTLGANLVALGKNWNIACYADGADDISVTAAHIQRNWVTGPSTWLRIFTPSSAAQVGVSQRHSGVFDPSRYYIYNAASRGTGLLIVGPGYVHIDGLQLWENIPNSTNIAFEVSPSSGQANITNNILRGGGIGAGLDISDITPATAVFANNVVYGFQYGFLDNTPGGSQQEAHLYNNTFYGNLIAFNALNARSVEVKNNIAQSAATACFDGTFAATSDYNICDAGGAPGAHAKNFTAVNFVNAAGRDFHLAVGDTAARGAGTDLSQDPAIQFSDTCDGTPRSGTWNMGAF